MGSIRKLIKMAFEKHPIVTNSIIYGSFCVSAEFSQQTMNKKILDKCGKPYDTSSITRFAIYGTSLGGPIISVWYRYLDKALVGVATKTVIKKVLIDQFIFTPQLLVVFFVAMSMMERKPDVFEELKQKFLSTFKTSCLFWLPAQTINFFLVPPALRVVYVGSCSFAWVNILCYVKRQDVNC